MAQTKEERAEYMRNWRAENKAHVKKYRHEYYMQSLVNGTYTYKRPEKEIERERLKKWRENNREKYNAYQRKYQYKIRMQKAIDNYRKV